MSPAVRLSDELSGIAAELKQLADRGPVSPVDAHLVAEQIDLSAQLAHSLEQELSVFRLWECQRRGASIVEQLTAGTVLDHAAASNVIAPAFGGKK
jgi:hypothetical protein